MSDSNGNEESTRAVFRMVNEQIRTLSENFSLNGRNSFICECGDASCTRAVELTLAEYESVRADKRRFIIASGHENPRLEAIIEEHEGFTIIETLHGDISRLAAETDAGASQVAQTSRGERVRS